MGYLVVEVTTWAAPRADHVCAGGPQGTAASRSEPTRRTTRPRLSSRSKPACWQPRTETFHHQHHSHDPATNPLGLGPRSGGPRRTRSPGSVGTDPGAGRR